MAPKMAGRSRSGQRMRRGKRAFGPQGSGAEMMSAWLSENRDKLIQCSRYEGSLLLTAASCAERHRRGVTGWVKSLGLSKDREHMLELSLAVCAECPIGARNYRMGHQSGKD